MNPVANCWCRRVSAVLAFAAFTLSASLALAETVNVTYQAATEVPITASSYTATGSTVNFTLHFAPATGAELMVVNLTGLDFIQGTFDNLAHGQPVALSYGGTTYHFVANYHGGSGNDLVLAWASTRVFAWGLNGNGQLGDNATTNHLVPQPVSSTGALAGKTVIALAAGGSHSLALCSDGTVAAWGWNYFGQLGDNTTTNRRAPVAVDAGPDSALNGRTVMALAAGGNHSLALCADGTVAAWGRNTSGQLGDNTVIPRLVPVAVNAAPGSALFGKVVVALAVGGGHSLALCADGTVAGWGYNADGQLGDNSMVDRHVPVAVNTGATSALQGRTAVAIAGGSQHSLALGADGAVVTWGWNGSGQLGNNTTARRLTPGLVNTDPGVSALAGKAVIAIASGSYHCLALCSDGAVTAWGINDLGELGDNTGGSYTSKRLVPVAVNTAAGLSVLHDRPVESVTTGLEHSLALCSDGTLAAWGYNQYGQLGDNATVNRLAPVAVKTVSLPAGTRFLRATGGDHTLALVAEPALPDIVLTSAAQLASGAFQFAFTNRAGAAFSVLATTNLGLPLSQWLSLGNATEASLGHYQFTDWQATNRPQRFYRVRSP